MPEQDETRLTLVLLIGVHVLNGVASNSSLVTEQDIMRQAPRVTSILANYAIEQAEAFISAVELRYGKLPPIPG